METLQSTEIRLPYPEANDLHLWLKLIGARLSVKPGATEDHSWVYGRYHDPSQRVPYRFMQEGGTAWLVQGQTPFDFLSFLNGVPAFDLALGQERPYMLTVEVGGSDASFELGGLPLTRLAVKQGAGRLDLDFAVRNPQALSMLQLASGAGEIKARNLVNANFTELSVEGGAGAFILNFGGTLQRSAHARISTGLSSVELQIPAATPAQIFFETALVSVNAGPGFTRQERSYLTPAILANNTTPALTIHLAGAVGSVQLSLV
jgi:hypothetical protein